MSEWFFIQSMKRKARERQLDEVRQAIKEADQKIADLRAKLDTVPLSEQKQHPLRIEWIRARTLYGPKRPISPSRWGGSSRSYFWCSAFMAI